MSDANAVCRPVQERLVSTTTVVERRNDDARAAAIEAVVAELADMVEDLSDLEPRVDDRSEVDAWLADWEAVLDSGRRTADAYAAGDRDGAALAADAGQGAARAVNAFTGANGIGACSTRFG